MPFSLTAPTTPIFPIYLLPTLPFRRRKSSTDTTTSTASTSSSVSSALPADIAAAAAAANEEEAYLSGHTSHLRCSHCLSDLCPSSQIISKGFTGRHGRAYLVASDKSAPIGRNAPPLSRYSGLPNTFLMRPMQRQLVTGSHTVSDVCCTICGVVLGWKYLAAEEESQRYKVGNFILETRRVVKGVGWEGRHQDYDDEHDDAVMLERDCGLSTSAAPARAASTPAGRLREKERIEFDSQDEDECEDLFAGVWSEGLAKRRREARRKKTFGVSRNDGDMV